MTEDLKDVKPVAWRVMDIADYHHDMDDEEAAIDKRVAFLNSISTKPANGRPAFRKDALFSGEQIAARDVKQEALIAELHAMVEERVGLLAEVSQELCELRAAQVSRDAEPDALHAACAKLHHWHDWGENGEGMIVSSDVVREIWQALAESPAHPSGVGEIPPTKTALRTPEAVKDAWGDVEQLAIDAGVEGRAWIAAVARFWRVAKLANEPIDPVASDSSLETRDPLRSRLLEREADTRRLDWLLSGIALVTTRDVPSFVPCDYHIGVGAAGRHEVDRLMGENLAPPSSRNP